MLKERKEIVPELLNSVLHSFIIARKQVALNATTNNISLKKKEKKKNIQLLFHWPIKIYIPS